MIQVLLRVLEIKIFGMKKEIGIIGLGKMGSGIALQLVEKGWKVIGFNRSIEKTNELAQQGVMPATTLSALVRSFESSPRVLLLMVPAGKPVDEMLFGSHGLVPLLNKGDIIIDGGNSNYKETIRRYKEVKKHGIQFIDCGISGGPSGARNGACCMVGGPTNLFKNIELLFETISVENGYAHFEGEGAGHFVKMVHNGIEYGMMQAIGEGFDVMKQSPFQLDLTKVASVYNHGSVITSSLIGWLHEAYVDWGENLEPISGSIHQSGEGKWTVETAEELDVDVPVIRDSCEFRFQSQQNPSYTGKVVSALRGKFGGHPVSRVAKK